MSNPLLIFTVVTKFVLCVRKKNNQRKEKNKNKL